MADHKPSGGGGGLDLVLWFLGILGVLFALWLVGEGPRESAENTSGISFGSTIRSGTLFDNDESETATETRMRLREEIRDLEDALDELEEETKEARIRGTLSPYEDMVSFGGDTDPEALFRHEEHVTLRASTQNNIDINLTGWSIESLVTGNRATLGTVTNLVHSGKVNPQTSLSLPPGGEVMVITGRSPLGTSFRINQCIGYLNQFQRFTPDLPEDCPEPEEEFEDYANVPTTNLRSDEDAYDICLDFVDSLPQCEMYDDDLEDVEPDLHNSCKAFIEEELNYSACVRNHQFEIDFYADEWRLYLSANWELWRDEREILRLLDERGRTVDVLTY
jgi:hypothetical protein